MQQCALVSGVWIKMQLGSARMGGPPAHVGDVTQSPDDLRTCRKDAEAVGTWYIPVQPPFFARLGEGSAEGHAGHPV